MCSQSELVELSQADGDHCPAEPPIWQRLQKAALEHENRLAVISIHQPPNLYNIDSTSVNKRYLQWTFAQLSNAVDRLSSGLVSHGIRRGEALATFLHNGAEFIIAFWAAHKLGCPFVPINPRSLANVSETTYMLTLAKVRAVIVQDEQAEENIDARAEISASIKVKISLLDKTKMSSWLSFRSLLNHKAAIAGAAFEAKGDETVTIFFTSGTTSLPKGVPMSNTNLNAICQNYSPGRSSRTHVFCTVLPNNHAFTYPLVLQFMVNGSAILFPSATFDAEATIRALETERATHTALVPTTLHALLEGLQSREKSLQSALLDVCLSGSSITPQDLHQVIRTLGSQGVSTGFGMTEGPPIWTAPKGNPEGLIYHDLTVAGSPSPGASVRICAPGTRVPVPRGERGEIHQSGLGLTKDYLGLEAGSDLFYTDSCGRRWFITGDQGLMLPDGRVCVTGRYKDMIIRGGENIAPAAIEAVIKKACGDQAQVVGVPDPIAGEIPIIVLRKLGSNSLNNLQDVVLQHFGPSHVPADLMTMEMLGLPDFPKTASGKVQKFKIVELVNAYRLERENHSDALEEGKSLQSVLLGAYYKATGIPISDLDLAGPITNFADSITVMRVRDYLRKSLGWTLSTQQMVDYPNIQSQAMLLQSLNTQMKQGETRAGPQISGPPNMNEISTQFGGSEEAEKMQSLVEMIVEKHGFNWRNDVASVLPAYDFTQVLLESKIIDTWNFAIAILANGANKGDLCNALKKALGNNPLMASFCVTGIDQKPYFATLRPSVKLWNLCIIDHGSVKTSSDVQQLAINYPYPEHSRVPGPLFRCIVVHVEETQSAALVIYVHHVIHDVSSQRLFYDDLNSALLKPSKPLRPHVDYGVWTDCYQAFRLSTAATASVNYHVKRLMTLPLHKNALYPPAPLPRQAITESPDGLDHAFDCPGLLTLKASNPTITTAVVLKAAMALVNVSRTNHTHALFNNFEAARTRFPFVPPRLESRNPALFEAADVNGPVMETITNMIPVPRNMSALAFLQNLQAEQLELTKHAHAPLLRVIAALNADGSGAGDMITEIQRTQFVTWIPGFLGEYERLQVAQIAIRCAMGLVIVAGVGGPQATTFQLSLRWDVANYSRGKTRAFVKDLEAATLWLVERKSWERPVGEFLDVLVGKGEGESELMNEMGRSRCE